MLVEGLPLASPLYVRLGEANGAIVVEPGHEFVQFLGVHPLGSLASHGTIFAGLNEVAPWRLLFSHEVIGDDDGFRCSEMIPLSSTLFTPPFSSLGGSLCGHGGFCRPIDVAIPRNSSLWFCQSVVVVGAYSLTWAVENVLFNLWRWCMPSLP